MPSSEALRKQDGQSFPLPFDAPGQAPPGSFHLAGISELCDYLIVSHRERRIDHYRRQGDGQWHLTTHLRNNAKVELAVLGGAIVVADAFAGVEFDEGRR